MASTPVVPFKATLSRPLGQGEVTRRMERTTARELAALTCSPQFKRWRDAQPDDTAAANDAGQVLGKTHLQWAQRLQPLLVPLLAALCMLILALVILKLIAKDSQQWQGSFANWEEAERQLEANELAWAPPGTFAAALSTFQAALEEAAHTTHQLKQESQHLGHKQAEAQRAASAFQAGQQELEAQLSKCAGRSSRLQKSLDSTAAELAAHQHGAAKLQTQLNKLQHEHEHTAASLSATDARLKDLDQLPPKLARVSKEADMCRREMNTLSGSQTKVHESLQEYLHQVKELQHELDGTKKHMSRVSRDYGVCQDTSAHLRFHVRQTKVRLLLMNSKALLKYSMVGINS
ncbi:hypothetical protein ABBQ38_005435 [Trebouxia sp. C0009 RCD-2024]